MWDRWAATGSPCTCSAIRRCGALNTIEVTVRDGYRFEQNMRVYLQTTEVSKDAMRAFIEKRKPVFKGRRRAYI
jgi:enoyl-CoA hydratase